MGNSFSILLVDDEPDNLQLVGEILREDYELLFAITGEKGLEIAMKTSPDIILLDIMMPVMDGYEVARKLKIMEKTQKIPIIFVTTKDEAEDETKGLTLGAVDYITKPLNASILKARVKNQLDLKIAREELEKQNQQLKDLLLSREDMVNMLAHDMRAPLASILGYTELLSIRPELTPETKDLLREIEVSGNSLHAFINDMLTIARTENKKLVLDFQLISVEKLLEPIQEIYKMLSKMRKIHFSIEIFGKQQKIKVDVKLFRRALDNLIGNAIKFTPKGKDVQLHIHYPEVSDSAILFQVIDQGPGIPEGERDRIFNRFEIAKLRKKGVTQTGLGLSFCKMVVEGHKGKIFVTDNQPEGSIFNIEI